MAASGAGGVAGVDALPAVAAPPEPIAVGSEKVAINWGSAVARIVGHNLSHFDKFADTANVRVLSASTHESFLPPPFPILFDPLPPERATSTAAVFFSMVFRCGCMKK